MNIKSTKPGDSKESWINEMRVELKPVYTNPQISIQICNLLNLDPNQVQHLKIDIDVVGNITVDAVLHFATYQEKEIF